MAQDSMEHPAAVEQDARTPHRAAPLLEDGARGRPAGGGCGRIAPVTRTASLQVSRAAGARYAYIRGEAEGGPRLVPLREGVSSVGSRPTCTLQLRHPTVSALHCELHNRQGRVRIVDCGSKNGVRIQGMRVPEVDLAVGQMVQLGRVTLLLLDAVPPDSAEGVELLPGVVGTSPAMRRLAERVQRLARSGLTVLVAGETGTGKELVARALHDLGRRATGPFVPLNCATLPEPLLESELFGHERGAFTGAAGRRAGLFEQANGGTLFLDEVAELPLSQQPKLLRALEQREIRRVGSSRPIAVDVRVVAATLSSLEARVAAGQFREDLYYRLSEATIRVPALAERREDIPLLVAHFWAADAGDGTPAGGAVALPALRPVPGKLEANRSALLRRLQGLSYPGNVRELRSLVRLAQVIGWEEALSQRATGRPWGDGGGPAGEAVAASRPTAGGGGAAGAVPRDAPCGAILPLVARDGHATQRPGWQVTGAAAASAPPFGSASPPARSLPELQRRMILEALDRAGGNRSEAARLLGIPKSTYADRLRRILRDSPDGM